MKVIIKHQLLLKNPEESKKETREIGDLKKNWDFPDHDTAEIDEKHGGLTLAVTRTSMKTTS